MQCGDGEKLPQLSAIRYVRLRMRGYAATPMTSRNVGSVASYRCSRYAPDVMGGNIGSLSGGQQDGTSRGSMTTCARTAAVMSKARFAPGHGLV